jgi:hypothetical protein
MISAQTVLEQYLQVPDVCESWLYLNPGRLRETFVTNLGAVEEFSIVSSRGGRGGGALKIGGTGLDASVDLDKSVSVSYEINDPLVMALLLRAYLREHDELKDPCTSRSGDFVSFVAPGRLTHPDLPGTESLLNALYQPDVAEAVEGSRSSQEAAAYWVNQGAKRAAVAFLHHCPVASIVDTQWINENWATRYNKPDGYLGIVGLVEPAIGIVRLVAPLHVWWQASA